MITGPSKDIEIKSLELTACHFPDLYFRTCVSKGTYVRALSEDIGNQLGTGAVLAALRRTRCGPFQVKASLSVERLKQLDTQSVGSYILPMSSIS